MKVLQVIDKSFLGGGQAALRNIVEGMRGTDVTHHVACRAPGPLVDAVRALGAPFHAVPFDKRFRPGPARALARLVRAERIDLVHAHGLVAAFYATLARELFGPRLPLLYHQHGFHHANYGRATVGLRKWTERHVCRRADRVIPVSRADLEALRAGGYAEVDRLRLVHYGVPEPDAPPEAVEAARKAARLEPGRPVVGLLGRLHPQKGVHVFLEAIHRLRRSRPEVQWVIVGGGEIEEELHERARALGLGSELRWMGPRPGPPFLRAFDVVVLSSLWEGLPLVLLEAMACGRPIVTSDVPGCLDAVGPDQAEITPRGDAAALAAAVGGLLDDPPRAARLGAAARVRYEEAFSQEAMVRTLRALYEEVAP